MQVRLSSSSAPAELAIGAAPRCYVDTHTHMYIHTYIYKHIYRDIYMYLYVCMYIMQLLHTPLNAGAPLVVAGGVCARSGGGGATLGELRLAEFYICIYTNIYIYTFICTYMFTCRCASRRRLRLYVFIYTDMDIYTFICMNIYTCSFFTPP